jgi:hypothetical protein
MALREGLAFTSSKTLKAVRGIWLGYYLNGEGGNGDEKEFCGENGKKWLEVLYEWKGREGTDTEGNIPEGRKKLLLKQESIASFFLLGKLFLGGLLQLLFYLLHLFSDVHFEVGCKK